jgi:hypothetical protein
VPGDAAPEGYLSRLVKYIPAEAITVHGAIQGFATSEAAVVSRSVMAWAGYLLLLLVPIWVLVMTRAPGDTPAWHQVLISTLAFLVWLAATNSPAVVDLVPGWRPLYGSIAMVACVVIVFPLLEQVMRRLSSAAQPGG